MCILRHHLMMSIDFRFKFKNNSDELEGSTSEGVIRLGSETHYISDLKEIIYYPKNNDITLVNKSKKQTQLTITEAGIGRTLSEKPPVRFVIESLDEIIGDNKEPTIIISNGNSH
jgi:hypothetical protein